MALIKCPECGKEISTLASTCPNCGAPQQQQANNGYIFEEYKETEPNARNNMSTNKILSIVALCCSIGGIFFGGLLLEIAAFVVSLIVLNSGEYKEKEAETFARVALIISIIISIIFVLYIIFAGGMLLSLFNKTIDLY